MLLGIVGAVISGLSSIFSATSGGALSALKGLATGLGLRFYAGVAVGLVITDSTVRGDAIDLGKAIIGAII